MVGPFGAMGESQGLSTVSVSQGGQLFGHLIERLVPGQFLPLPPAFISDPGDKDDPALNDCVRKWLHG